MPSGVPSVVAVRNRLPGPDVWLILRRDIVDGELKFFLSNAPLETVKLRP
jgi:hypothetical protein